MSPSPWKIPAEIKQVYIIGFSFDIIVYGAICFMCFILFQMCECVGVSCVHVLEQRILFVKVGQVIVWQVYKNIVFCAPKR